ncbi:unnamed protein product [Staurois parvus]|uniref:Uncharacterized protein n=1 Tax=Staurois parvus TaxID=386267 RepID=A0ABN9GEU0_9NEOB|nr:unnamed protein product [Staurois parvus]
MWCIPLFYCVSFLRANYYGMYVFVYWLGGGCLLMCLRSIDLVCPALCPYARKWVVPLNVYILWLSPGFLQVWCCLVLYGHR